MSDIDRTGPAASCHLCVGAGGYEDYDGSWVECSCQKADREASVDATDALAYLDELNQTDRIEYDDYRNLHDLISPLAEPQAELFPGTLDALNGLTIREGQS